MNKLYICHENTRGETFFFLQNLGDASFRFPLKNGNFVQNQNFPKKLEIHVSPKNLAQNEHFVRNRVSPQKHA